jgi:phage gp37-like protein
MSELKVDKVSPRSGTYLAVGTLSYKNILINGDMSIAQRSTSVASITGSGYYTVDRMNLALISLGTWTQSQSTDVPTGQGFATSLKMDCTTADAAPSASDQVIIQQRIEGQNLQYLKKGTANAESLTLSFWVKSNKTGTYVVNILDNDNSRQISNSYTINASNTWEKKTLTFAGDTTGVFGNDNNLSIELNFWLGAGSTYTSGTLQTSWTSTANADLAVGQVNLADDTANEWYITGVQLEAGTTASDFEFLPYDVNLQRCLRYYFKDDCRLQILTARVSDALRLANFRLPVPMRAAPTFTGITSTEIGNTAVQDSSKYAITFQQSGSDGLIPRYDSFECKAEL